MNKSLIRCVLLASMLTTATHATASDTEETWPELSLGDLMKVGVESASRKSQVVSNTSAAIFVISAADIKRSGALSVPEALRLAPGIEAARQSNNKWAISIRGFNGRMANKLLVLVDGRSIYSSLYGGVLWEAENIPLEEINRIEVIRGSAGLAWGSNAVNGVINIITKRAQDTEGWLVDGHAGTSTGKVGVAMRYGKKIDDGSAVRVSLSGQRRDEGQGLNGTAVEDEWNDNSLDFRYDRPDGIDTRYFISGRLFNAQSGDPWMIPTFDPAATYDAALYGTARLAPFVSTKNGGNLLGRMEQTTDDGGEIRIQTYIEKFYGRVQSTTEDHTTLDVDAQHRFPLGDAHDIVWGGNYRQTRHHAIMAPDGFLTTSNPDITVALSSLFVQDEWTLIPRTFNIQAGIRIEHQTFGGTTPQPSIRGMWTPNEQNSLWLSWSKTVRSPSVVDRTMGAYAAAMPAGINGLPTLIYSNPGEQSGFGNEHARSLEAGHHAQWTPFFFSDLSAYISDYDGVFGVLPGWTVATNLDPACAAALARFGLTTSPTPPQSAMCMTVNRGNRYQVRTRGLELSTEWNPSTTWRLQFNTSRLWMDAGENNSYTANSVVYGNSPHYQSSLRSSYNVTQNRQFDLWLRRIGGMDYGGYFSGTTGKTPINARTELDLRFAEQVNESLELSLNLQNLLSKNQLQFYPDLIPSLPVVPQRTIYLKALWHGR